MDEDLVAEFEAACQHAGVPRDHARLWLVDGDPLGIGRPAVHYPPGWSVDGDDPLFRQNARAQANAPGVRQLHRIAVRRGSGARDPVETAAVAGLMRHQLEHARQFGTTALGNRLHGLDGLATRVADAIDGGGDATYRTKPVETAANRAAAAFLRERHPAASEALRHTRLAPLAREGEPLPIDELPRRTVEWIAARGDAIDADDVFEDGLTWCERVDAAFPGAGDWWPASDELVH